MSKTLKEYYEEYGYDIANKGYTHFDSDDAKQLLTELGFLQYFYDAVDDVLGPASDDVYEMIKEQYVEEGNDLPEGY